jgi:hypothetical protein
MAKMSFALLVAITALTATSAHAADTCDAGVLKNGTWTFACVDDRGRNVCLSCSDQKRTSCTRKLGICPS